MAPEHVAHGVRASYGMTHVTPEHITAWERGVVLPSASELAALAAALWCSPGDLMGRPRTLFEHRLARGVAAEDVARVVGVPVDAYLEMERAGRWVGDRMQSARLGEFFQLPPGDLVAITGLQDELARLLVEAVTTRWQAHIKDIAKLTSIDKRDLKEPLRSIHQEYQSIMAATLGRSIGAAADEEGRRYLDSIVDRFWERFSEG
ncbi:XRE family transcriptional regulator [Streptomyces triticagri]|uniref:XRE family transcriptional regulator n=1 Tax=Streptomyces triticagri TaxID=2293568 RepID=A0A372M5B7_9ACTN|nr:XRE family transcriptional regulator [Streptomyces triticagri]RFU85497.1 XRE family transcriptional regulator [Streptomyces triticagri]